MRFRAMQALLAAFLVSSCGFGGGGITPVRTPFNKGVHHQSRGELDAAITFYREAIEENALDHRARFNLGTALEARARAVPATEQARWIEEAEQHYRLLLEQRPEDLRASINLAALEYECGEREIGIARLQETIERHPGVALPYTALAAHRIQAGQLEEAEELLREALDADAGSLTAQSLLGDCLHLQERMDEARGAYLGALETDSADVATLLAVARLERQQDRPKDAAARYLQVLLILPDHVQAHLERAALLKQLGDREEAVRHLWEVRTLTEGDPNAPDVNPALQRLYRELLDRESR